MYRDHDRAELFMTTKHGHRLSRHRPASTPRIARMLRELEGSGNPAIGVAKQETEKANGSALVTG